MRKLLLLFCFGLLTSLTVWGQSSINGNITATSSTCGTNNVSQTTACVVMPITPTSGAAGVAITGTFTATVQFEVSANNGATWVAISGFPPSSTSGVSSATAAGTWRFAVSGLTHIRVRCSAYTSGTPNVQITTSTSAASLNTGGGGGGGTTTNALTMNNSGSGDVSGSAFDGSSALTLSYNTIGAVPTTRTVAGKALSSNVTIAQTDLTAGNYTIGAYYIDQAEIAAPANPSAGVCRQYVDSTTHKVTFLNSSGASCIASGGGGITNSAPNLHLMESDGTNAIDSGIVRSTNDYTFPGAVIATTSVGAGTAPTACGTATGCFGATANTTASTQTAGQGSIRLDTSSGWLLRGVNGASEAAILFSGGDLGTPASGTGTNITGIPQANVINRYWSCQTGMGDGINAMASASYLQSFCYNDTGATVTISGIKCYADAGTPTLNATNGAGTALLTGAVTCTSSFAAGTQSATTTIASGDYIKFTFAAGGTAKQTTWVVTGTY